AFALIGRWGRYDQPTNSVWFDLDGDGRGFDEPNSPEVFTVREHRVNIGGKTFEFRVDHYGRSLVLVPQQALTPARPPLTQGTTAPDFSVMDIDGHRQSLKPRRGEVVLLDF